MIYIKKDDLCCNPKKISKNPIKCKQNFQEFIYKEQDADILTISIGIKDGKIKYLPFTMRHLFHRLLCSRL